MGRERGGGGEGSGGEGRGRERGGVKNGIAGAKASGYCVCDL